MKKFAFVITTIFLIMSFKSFSQSVSENSMTKDVERLAKLYLEEVVNNRRLDLLPQIFSEKYVFHEMDGRSRYRMKNDSLKLFLETLFLAFPDIHYTIDNLVKENNKIAIGCTATGTHKGEFFGRPASGNKVVYKEIFIYRIDEGKIVEGWGVVDLGGILDQISKK